MQQQLLLILAFDTLSWTGAKRDFLDNINSVLCESDEIDGVDPNRIFRTGHKYTLDECVGTSALNDISDLTNCAIAPRRRAPACDSYYASNAGEEWTSDVSAQGPYFTPFYPGGPGIGQSPFPSWAIACLAGYPAKEFSEDYIDYAVEFLCEKTNDDSSSSSSSSSSGSSSSSSSSSSDEEDTNKWAPFDLIFCQGNTQNVESMFTTGICQEGTVVGGASNEQFCQIDLTSEYFECDGKIPERTSSNDDPLDSDSNSNSDSDEDEYDCMIFTKFIGIAGADCEHGFFGGDDDEFNSLGNNRFGFEWYNAFEFGTPIGFIPNAEAHLLCGKKSDWQDENMQHTICKISDFDNLNTQESYLGNDFTQKGYTFSDGDCSNGVPTTNGNKNGRCIATIRSTRYCCEYSFNFKGIGPDETVDGVNGPGVVFQVWKDGQDDESVCDNRSLKKDVQIEYLCFQG